MQVVHITMMGLREHERSLGADGPSEDLPAICASDTRYSVKSVTSRAQHAAVDGSDRIQLSEQGMDVYGQYVW